jgi:hypothetical protein
LYVADSESNIIRAIDLTTQQVKTLVGGDLFEFGDVDGKGDDVRLQHPLGLFPLGEKILIADTYNHKIKELDPRQKTVKSFLGTGKPGQAEGSSPSFYEPGGLSVANGILYVADTNNHAIRAIDLKSKAISTLRIEGLEPPASTAGPSAEATPNLQEIKVPRQRLRASSDGSVVVTVKLPAAYHLNPSAPQRISATIESGADHIAFKSEPKSKIDGNKLSQTSKDLRLPFTLPLRTLASGQAELSIQLTLFYCREDNTGTCLIKTIRWIAPIDIEANPAASSEIKVQAKVESE